MLKALLKVNLAALLSWLSGSGKSNGKSRSKVKAVLYALLMIYALGVFCWLFAQVFGMLAGPLYTSGCGWLYFVYVYIVAFAIMFIFSVFAAKNRLYEAKDNDLLLSMPIPPSAILASRMTLLFAMNVLFGAMVVGPAVYEWYQVVMFDAASLVFMILEFFGLCLFSLALSALFGWLLSLVSSRMRKKTLIETLVSFVFLAAYFYVYSQLNAIVSSLIQNNYEIAESLGAVAPLYWIGAGAAGDLASFALGMLVFALPFAAVYYILSKTFIKTATAKRGAAKIKYEAKEQKVSSGKSALLRREAERFFSSSTCIVNNGLGAVLILIATVFVILYGGNFAEFMDMIEVSKELAVCFCALGVIMMSGMVVPTSSSVSLEGKSIWAIQAMPVAPAQVLLAKLKFCLFLYLPPAALCMLAVVFVFGASADVAVFSVIGTLATVVVMAEIGLIANVNHPLLNWTSETQALKSSGSIIISMLIDMGILVTLGFGGYLMLDKGASFETMLGVLAVVMLLAARLLYGYIITKAAKKFAYLS